MPKPKAKVVDDWDSGWDDADEVSDGLTRARGIADAEELDYTPRKETGDIEKDEGARVGATLLEMRRLAKLSQERLKTALDGDYMTVITFMSQAQARAFEEAMNMSGIKNGRYVDGIALAKMLDIELPPVVYKPYEPHEDKKFAELSWDIE
jgi:hypothetical protein